MSTVLSRDEKRWSGIRAFCSGCGLLVEEGEPRLVMWDGNAEGHSVITMRHDACERKGTLPIFKSDIRGKLTNDAQVPPVAWVVDPTDMDRRASGRKRRPTSWLALKLCIWVAQGFLVLVLPSPWSLIALVAGLTAIVMLPPSFEEESS